MASDREVPDKPPMDLVLEPSRHSFDHDVLPSIPSQPAVPQSAVSMSSHRRRRRSSVSAGLRRSSSTPNVRGSAGSHSNMSLADRRGGRNKLGYHRTSIACGMCADLEEIQTLTNELLTGHCRRRKIRCLPADNDPSQKCANCIKLKKECSFLPVDHPPGAERRHRTNSRGQGTSRGSSSCSPPMPGMMNHIEDFNHFPQLPLPTQEFPLSHGHLHANTVSPHGRGRSTAMNSVVTTANPSTASIGARPNEFIQHREQQPWDSPYLDHGPMSAGYSTPEEPSQGHWRSPLTPAFPPAFSGPPTSSSSRESGGSFTSFAPPPPSHLANGLGFPMPPRSMSVHGGQDYQRTYQGRISPTYENDIGRRASEMVHSRVSDMVHPRASEMVHPRASEMMYPPSLQASRNSSNTSISEPSNTPLSNQWGISQSSWTPIPVQTLACQPDFGWYSPEPGLPQVQEEEIPPPFGSPPIVYQPDSAHR